MNAAASLGELNYDCETIFRIERKIARHIRKNCANGGRHKLGAFR